MKARTETINYLIEQNGLTNYLEIGVDNPNSNFNLVKCETKTGVDPYILEDHNKFDACITKQMIDAIDYRMTSDEFFEQNEDIFDIVFIDGLHTEEQVMKDILNAMECLDNNGYIVVHDVMPRSLEAQIVPRIQAEWNGDVWKAIYDLVNAGVDIDVIPDDYGIAIIKKQDIDKTKIEKCLIDYNLFDIYKQSLDIIGWQQFLEKYRKQK